MSWHTIDSPAVKESTHYCSIILHYFLDLFRRYFIFFRDILSFSEIFYFNITGIDKSFFSSVRSRTLRYEALYVCVHQIYFSRTSSHLQYKIFKHISIKMYKQLKKTHVFGMSFKTWFTLKRLHILNRNTTLCMILCDNDI